MRRKRRIFSNQNHTEMRKTTRNSTRPHKPPKIPNQTKVKFPSKIARSHRRKRCSLAPKAPSVRAAGHQNHFEPQQSRHHSTLFFPTDGAHFGRQASRGSPPCVGKAAPSTSPRHGRWSVKSLLSTLAPRRQKTPRAPMPLTERP